MLPRSANAYAYLVDLPIWIVLIGTLIVGIISFGIVFYVLFRYSHKRSPHPEVFLPRWIKWVVGVDILVMVLDLLLLTIGTYGWANMIIRSEEKIRTQAEKEGKRFVKVKVVGRQFFWSFSYAGLDGKWGTGDDFTLGDRMVIPEDSYVYLEITSGDTLHSFFAPHFRVKYDAIPGRTTHLWFKTLSPGEFEIACAELCGSLHYKMKGVIQVLSQEDYDLWLRRISHGGA